MRKWIILSLAAVFGMGVPVAFADVFVFADIEKNKDILVFEQLEKFKFVVLNVRVDAFVERATESEALINQFIDNNFYEDNETRKKDELLNSGNDNRSLLTINQAAGNMNNQGSAISVAISTTGEVRSFAEAQAAVQQDNFFENSGEPATEATFSAAAVLLSTREALIVNSLNNNTGIVAVNQSPGSMNNQANAVALAFSRSGGVALSEADLGQVNAANTVTELGVQYKSVLTSSVNSNTGIVGVNQSSGNLANQANVVSFAASVAQ